MGNHDSRLTASENKMKRQRGLKEPVLNQIYTIPYRLKVKKKKNTLQDKLHNECDRFLNKAIQIGQFLNNIAKYMN